VPERATASDSDNESSSKQSRESATRRAKREEYAKLSSADLKALVELGIERVDEFAQQYYEVVSAVTYLHTRRQRILQWLADTDAFSLLAWSDKCDEFQQPFLVLRASRPVVHAALRILLKSDPTEWLFKRFRNPTTAEGRWLFKRDQHAFLIMQAAKAIGKRL